MCESCRNTKILIPFTPAQKLTGINAVRFVVETATQAGVPISDAATQEANDVIALLEAGPDLTSQVELNVMHLNGLLAATLSTANHNEDVVIAASARELVNVMVTHIVEHKETGLLYEPVMQELVLFKLKELTGKVQSLAKPIVPMPGNRGLLS